MTEVSKQVANREAITRTVVNSATHHGPIIVDPLERFLFPEGVPEVVTLGVLIEAMGKALVRTTEVMHNADLTLAAEIADDAAPRTARDTSIQAIREMLMDFSALVEGTYGADALKLCGLQGLTPRWGDTLANDGDNVAGLLKGNPFAALAPKPGREPLKAPKMAEALEAEVAEFKKSLEDVDREEREYQAALGARDLSVEQWSLVYPNVTDALGAFYSLAGRSDLADRVRPTARRRAGQPEEADTTPTEEQPT
jgi:hypothetical protein